MAQQGLYIKLRLISARMG